MGRQQQLYGAAPFAVGKMARALVRHALEQRGAETVYYACRHLLDSTRGSEAVQGVKHA